MLSCIEGHFIINAWRIALIRKYYFLTAWAKKAHFLLKLFLVFPTNDCLKCIMCSLVEFDYIYIVILSSSILERCSLFLFFGVQSRGTWWLLKWCVCTLSPLYGGCLKKFRCDCQRTLGTWLLNCVGFNFLWFHLFYFLSDSFSFVKLWIIINHLNVLGIKIGNFFKFLHHWILVTLGILNIGLRGVSSPTSSRPPPSPLRLKAHLSAICLPSLLIKIYCLFTMICPRNIACRLTCSLRR